MMNYETQLAAIEHELARQDAELAIARDQIAAFGDCEFQFAEETLCQIDDACIVHVSATFPIHNGLQG